MLVVYCSYFAVLLFFEGSSLKKPKFIQNSKVVKKLCKQQFSHDLHLRILDTISAQFFQQPEFISKSEADKKFPFEGRALYEATFAKREGKD